MQHIVITLWLCAISSWSTCVAVGVRACAIVCVCVCDEWRCFFAPFQVWPIKNLNCMRVIEVAMMRCMHDLILHLTRLPYPFKTHRNNYASKIWKEQRNAQPFRKIIIIYVRCYQPSSADCLLPTARKIKCSSCTFLFRYYSCCVSGSSYDALPEAKLKRLKNKSNLIVAEMEIMQ